MLTEHVGAVADRDGDDVLRCQVLHGELGGALSPEQLAIQEHIHRKRSVADRRLRAETSQ